MKPANYSLTTSCAHTSTHGGARNTKETVRFCLTEAQTLALIEAANFANLIGKPFQRHWTIHYGKAGIDPSGGAQFVSRILDMVGKQARREGGQMAAIWVRECASDKGEHVHILLHLPAGMRLHGRTRRWIENASSQSPKDYGKGISKIRIVGGRLSIRENSGGSPYQIANADNVLAYMLKGASAETGIKLGLSRYGESGAITGKRCGWTQNIGQAARNRFFDTPLPANG